MYKWPKFEDYEEYVAALPAILDYAYRLCKRARSANVEPDEVFGRMLVKIQTYWYNIPKGTGQTTYLWRIYYSCLMNELKSTGRSTFSAQKNKPWMEIRLIALSEAARSEPLVGDGLSDFRKVLNAELRGKYGIHTLILILREAKGMKWDKVAALVGFSVKTCQKYNKIIKIRFRECYPHFRDLLGEV
jgi:DNA-directed RNA polymerase specialized sigma24 family protein